MTFCDKNDSTEPILRSGIDRRTWLALGSMTAAGFALAPFVRKWFQPAQPVFVAKNQSYDGPLAKTISDGLAACGLDFKTLRGKKVLLKPNLVEPAADRRHMTTHPAMVVAAAEVFLNAGAQVKIGEAPGHVRDTEMALIASGMGEALYDARLEFADLNYEATEWRENRSKCSKLDGLFLPQSVAEADLLVSMPKMKTHHWQGMTCAMKNLYGILPGIKYGWPKNVLHHHGIPQTVVDINAAAPQTIAIVDGIDCMEGDGPILGTKKWMGLVAVGLSPIAVDATIARMMGLLPERIPYLAIANGKLGSVAERHIEQRGEAWQSLVNPFAVMDQPHLRNLRATPNGPLVT